MSHALINRLGLVLGAALIIAGCSGSDNSAAESLLTQAQEANSQGLYETAIRLVDSIKSAYPRAIEVRKKALHTLAVAQEGVALATLQRADSVVAALTVSTDSLQKLMKKVANPVEPYFVAAASNPADVRNVTGLQARMSPDGDLYIIATLKGTSAKSTSVSIRDSSGATAHTSTVAFDGERNDRTPGLETITFMGSECEDIANFIASHRGDKLHITFEDSRPFTTLLPPKQIDEIALVYDAASTLRALRVASVERERATRALDIARSQAARTFPEEKAEN